MKYIILFTIFLLNTAYNQTQESIYERINLAKSYVEAGFKEDAVEVYKNIISMVDYTAKVLTKTISEQSYD